MTLTHARLSQSEHVLSPFDFVLEPAKEGGDEYRSVRGGAWSSVENHCRAAARFVNRPDQRRSAIGLRVGRSYP